MNRRPLMLERVATLLPPEGKSLQLGIRIKPHATYPPPMYQVSLFPVADRASANRQQTRGGGLRHGQRLGFLADLIHVTPSKPPRQLAADRMVMLLDR